MNIMIRSPE